jgi:hypothetical protein
VIATVAAGLLVATPVSANPADAGATAPLVALVGGSITRQPADAAGLLDPAGHFTHDYPSTLNGGTVLHWADPSDFRWASFDTWVAEHPQTTAVWWQVVFHEINFTNLGQAQLQADAEAAFQHLKARLGGRAVYVSPMFHYLPGSRCTTSDAAVAAAEAIVETLLAEHPALRRGPVFAPVPPDQVAPRGCHTTDEGDDVQGAVLNAFFAAALG